MTKQQEAALFLALGVVGLVALQRFTNKQALALGLPAAVVGVAVWALTQYSEGIA